MARNQSGAPRFPFSNFSLVTLSLFFQSKKGLSPVIVVKLFFIKRLLMLKHICYLFTLNKTYVTLIFSNNKVCTMRVLQKPFGSLIERIDRINQSINFKIKNQKAAQYELTSPILYMEQYIPFSLIICEPFSRILETL